MPDRASLVVRYRGAAREAAHLGNACIVDPAGHPIFSAGDVDERLLPRSAAKLIQALPYLECGAADAGRDEEIVLAAASHVAEPEQLAVLHGWAARLGVGETDLACGPDIPLGRFPNRPGATEISAFHNNNAGKHLAVIASCLALGEPFRGYAEPDHPAQKRLVAALQETCSLAALPETFETDNCGMVTFPLPIGALARGMARLASGRGLAPARHAASRRLLEAIARAPGLFAGSRRLGTRLVTVTAGRVIAKGGSEGVYAALDRRSGLGFALKVGDGSGEAASAALIEMLAAAGSLAPGEATELRRHTQFWAHARLPERSPRVEFPFLDGFAGNFKRS